MEWNINNSTQSLNCCFHIFVSLSVSRLLLLCDSFVNKPFFSLLLLFSYVSLCRGIKQVDFEKFFYRTKPNALVQHFEFICEVHVLRVDRSE